MEFLLIVFWLACAVGVGMLANSKGRSFWGYALLSIITSPILGLVVALLVSDLYKEAAKKQEQATQNERHLESLKAIARSNTAASPTQDNISVADELEKLASLKERGILTEDEFTTKKAQLLKS